MYVTSQLLDVLAQHMSSQKDATWWSEQSKGTCCLSHRRETAIDSCHDNIAEFVTSAFGAVARAVPIANQQHHHQDWQHSKCWNPVWWVGKRAHGTTCIGGSCWALLTWLVTIQGQRMDINRSHLHCSYDLWLWQQLKTNVDIQVLIWDIKRLRCDRNEGGAIWERSHLLHAKGVLHNLWMFM